MSMTRDNLSPPWRVMLCQCAAAILWCASTSFAQTTNEIHANRPVAPSAPVAGDIPAPHPHQPLAPQATESDRAATTAREMEERMRELARRMATVESAGQTKGEARDDVKLAPLSDAQRAAADRQATTSNNQRIADPADAKPLGARRQAPVAEPLDAGSNTASSALTVLTALGFVIALIFILRAGMRKMMGTSAAVSSSAVVQVLTRVAVAPRNHVVLLRVGGRILVVSDSPSGMRTLSQIDEPEEVADILTSVSSAKSTSSTVGFRQMLSSLGASYDAEPPTAEAGSDENEFRIDRARDNVSGLLGKLRNLTGRGGAK